MTREEVQERLDRFLALPLHGRHAVDEVVAEALSDQDELITEIERLRTEEMLPILEEIAEFIGGARVDRVVD